MIMIIIIFLVIIIIIFIILIIAPKSPSHELGPYLLATVQKGYKKTIPNSFKAKYRATSKREKNYRCHHNRDKPFWQQ